MSHPVILKKILWLFAEAKVASPSLLISIYHDLCEILAIMSELEL